MAQFLVIQSMKKQRKKGIKSIILPKLVGGEIGKDFKVIAIAWNSW